MFKYCKLILAGIGGVAKQVPEGFRPEGKPRKARNTTNPEGAVLPRRPLQKKKITIEFRPRGFRNFCRGFCIHLPGQQLRKLQKMKRPEKRIFDLVQNQGRTDITPIKNIVISALQRIQEVAKADQKITGIASGFDDLDLLTAGFQKSDLILIAARPSMGKTALVLNIAQHACFKENCKCLFFSLEMSKEQLVNRLLAMESRVDSQNIRIGHFLY